MNRHLIFRVMFANLASPRKARRIAAILIFQIAAFIVIPGGCLHGGEILGHHIRQITASRTAVLPIRWLNSYKIGGGHQSDNSAVRYNIESMAPYLRADYADLPGRLNCYIGVCEIVGIVNSIGEKSFYQWSIGSSPAGIPLLSSPSDYLPFPRSLQGFAAAFGGSKILGSVNLGLELGYRDIPGGELKNNSMEYRRYMYNPYAGNFRPKKNRDFSGPYISAAISFLP